MSWMKFFTFPIITNRTLQNNVKTVISITLSPKKLKKHKVNIKVHLESNSWAQEKKY